MASHVDDASSDQTSAVRTRTPDGRARTRRTSWRAARGATWRFLAQLFRAAIDDSITGVAAMMAYYTVLAIFPMIVFIITLALLVLDHATIEQGVRIATAAMPAETAPLIAEKVTGLVNAASGGFAIGGAVVALWGASRGALALATALNTISSTEETRPWWRRQLIAIGVTLGVAVAIVLALSLLVVGPIAGHWVADRLGLGGAFAAAWRLARWVGAGLLVMVVWAGVFKLLPNTRARFRIFTPGAIVGVLVWLGASWLFGVYLEYFNTYEATYGTLGAAIVFLTWLWFSNIAILFGAEIDDLLARRARERSAPATR